MMHRFLLLIVLSNAALVSVAQLQPDKTYMKNIQGIRLFKKGQQMTYPVIQLGTEDAAELHFDDLDATIKQYNYTFQLCNADWQPVALSLYDYIKGFLQARLTQYRASSVAKTKYIHYQASLPNSSCMPTQAGNYLLKVFLNGDTSKLAFTKRLLIINNIVPVALQIQQPFNSQFFLTHQKAQFTLDKGKLNVLNPQQQIKVVVLQNFRWDNVVSGIVPVFMRNNLYEYNGEVDCLFPAGKEYRWADIRSYRFLSERLDSINRNTKPANLYLKPDYERTRERFVMMADSDGFFEISCTDASNPWWQGDYAHVHFTYVPAGNQPYPDKNVFIAGQMTNYALDETAKMEYNAEQGIYEKDILLKQGYYSYTYLTKSISDKMQKANATQTDGDYWETENAYTVLVYYRSLGGRYDELVGMATINSRTGRNPF